MESPPNPISGLPARGITGNSHLLQGISQLSQHSIQKCPTASRLSNRISSRILRREILLKNVACLRGMFIGFFCRKRGVPMYQRKHKSPRVRPCVVRNTKPFISIKTIEKGSQVFLLAMPNLWLKLNVDHELYLSRGFSYWLKPNGEI